jgi:hypothetical protein
MTMRRFGAIAGVVVVLWIVFLVILGAALGERYRTGIADRLGESLQATGAIDESNLALVRGRLELQRLHLGRDDVVGKLTLDVGDVRCELLPLGFALADSQCRELAVSNMRLEVSTLALFKLRPPKRPPLRASYVVIDDAVLVFSPSAMSPGIGRVQITIEHAEAGPTTFKTPLSWLFSLRTLRATIELPAGITVKLGYDNGRFAATGTLFGPTPVTLPISLPPADPADDAQAEVKKLVRLGRELAERLVEQRAQDWLKSKLQL